MAVAVAAVVGLATAAVLSGPAKPARTPSPSAVLAAGVAPGLADVTASLGYQGLVSGGTGMVLTPSGEVLTNNHVIEGATSVMVTDVGNHRRYPATVIGYDESRDIAVLRLIGASRLHTVSLGSSSTLTVGQHVVALGNAGGKGGAPAIATGRVTGLGQSITAMDAAAALTERLTGLIRTSAGIQPGDSGGPLLNSAGEVVGMNTAGSSAYRIPSATSQSFAIPISLAISIADRISAGEATATIHIGETAFLGLLLLSQGTPGPGLPPGVIVARVDAGTPAARAGLSAGDVLVSLGGRPVTSPSQVRTALIAYHPGDRIGIGWADRAGQLHTAVLALAPGPAG